MQCPTSPAGSRACAHSLEEDRQLPSGAQRATTGGSWGHRLGGHTSPSRHVTPAIQGPLTGPQTPEILVSARDASARTLSSWSSFPPHPRLEPPFQSSPPVQTRPGSRLQGQAFPEDTARHGALPSVDSARCSVSLIIIKCIPKSDPAGGRQAPVSARMPRTARHSGCPPQQGQSREGRRGQCPGEAPVTARGPAFSMGLGGKNPKLLTSPGMSENQRTAVW